MDLKEFWQTALWPVLSMEERREKIERKTAHIQKIRREDGPHGGFVLLIELLFLWYQFIAAALRGRVRHIRTDALGDYVRPLTVRAAVDEPRIP